jgi:hypothetical protein
VDEGMIMYKGKYCPIRQYMLLKPEAADALSKYLWNFKIYCGKSGNPYDGDGNDSSTDFPPMSPMPEDCPRSGKGGGFYGRNIVNGLIKDLHGRGHIVTTDNYFTSMPLFMELLENGTMATRTLRANQKYVPKAMFAKKRTKK